MPRQRRPTIVDVARRAGVSTTTVSHVINGTRFVSSETKQAVERAIAESGYRTNFGARALRTAKSEAIGLIIPSWGLPVLDEVVQAVERAVNSEGMVLLLASSQDSTQHEWAAIESFLDRGVDGLMLMPVGDTYLTEPAAFESLGVPIVVLDRQAHGLADEVRVESRQTMSALTDHLIACERKSLCFVGLGSNAQSISERLDGFTESAARAGHVPQVVVKQDAIDLKSALRTVLSSTSRPDAIVSGSQMSTVIVLEVLADLGLRMPTDVAIVAFDDVPFAGAFGSRLTCAVQPTEELGVVGVRLLLDRISGSAGIPDVRREVLNPTLRHGLSCGCSGDVALGDSRPAPSGSDRD